LLLLFCFLLALAVPLVTQIKEKEALQEKLAKIEQQFAELEHANQALSEADNTLSELTKILGELEPGKGIQDITKEYVRMKERIKIMTSEHWEEHSRAFERIAEQTTEWIPSISSESPIDIANSVAREFLMLREMKDVISKTMGGTGEASDPTQLQKAVNDLLEKARQSDLSKLSNKELVETAQKLEENLKESERRSQEAEKQFRQREAIAAKEMANTKGQMENLRKQLGKGGRGVEKVPCWATEDGRSENIFDVALNTSGFVVRDRKLPHRQEDQKKLPLEKIVFGLEVAPTQFLAMTNPLFQWSEAHECRFFVRVFDRTGVVEKIVYKRRLRELGDRFYHYEEMNEQF